MQVLRAFQTHYPAFFKDKTEKDKALLAEEYKRVFANTEDRIFLVGAGRWVKNNHYFPTIKELQLSVKQVQGEADRKRIDDFYRDQNTKKYASLSDEDCELMMDIWRAFGVEPLDWYEIRENARKELERSEIDGEKFGSRQKIES